MATEKTFKVAGVSKHEGEYKVRFANDIMRIKVLAKHGHEDIRLAELDEPMTKWDAINSIRTLDEYSDPAARICIDDWLAQNAPKTVSVKAGPAVIRAKTDSVIESTEDDDVPF